MAGAVAALLLSQSSPLGKRFVIRCVVVLLSLASLASAGYSASGVATSFSGEWVSRRVGGAIVEAPSYWIPQGENQIWYPAVSPQWTLTILVQERTIEVGVKELPTQLSAAFFEVQPNVTQVQTIEPPVLRGWQVVEREADVSFGSETERMRFLVFSRVRGAREIHVLAYLGAEQRAGAASDLLRVVESVRLP